MQLGQSNAGNPMGIAKVSHVQCMHAVGIAVLGAGGKAMVLRAKPHAVDGVLVEYDSVLCCGAVTSVCDTRFKSGDAREIVFAECDAGGESSWLVVQTAAASLKPVAQVRYDTAAMSMPQRRLLALQCCT